MFQVVDMLIFFILFSKPELARLRLQAGCCMLKIAEEPVFADIITREQFQALALLINVSWIYLYWASYPLLSHLTVYLDFELGTLHFEKNKRIGYSKLFSWVFFSKDCDDAQIHSNIYLTVWHVCCFGYCIILSAVLHTLHGNGISGVPFLSIISHDILVSMSD